MRIFLFIFLAGFALTSCHQVDNMTFTKAEREVMGEWKIKRVQNRIKKDGKWGKNDVSQNYRDWTFTFNTDYSATLYIPDEDLFLEGIWEMYETTETDNDGDVNLVKRLYIYVYDPDNWDVYREFDWRDMRISSTKFVAQELRYLEGDEHRYYYELSK